MKTIERIKNELGKISKWPWFWERCYEYQSNRKHWALCNDDSRKNNRVINGAIVLIVDRDKWLGSQLLDFVPELNFMALSPERIALLVEYFEASEAWFKVEVIDESELMQFPELARLQKARAALEREEL